MLSGELGAGDTKNYTRQIINEGKIKQKLKGNIEKCCMISLFLKFILYFLIS